MAAPVFQAVGTQFAATNATTATWPTHQTGDIGVLVVEIDGLGTAITISGWTSQTNAGDNTVGSKLQVLWKRAASAAEPAVSIPDTGDHQIGAIFTFRGCRASGNPFFGTQTSSLILSNAGSVTWPTLTTTENDLLVLLIATRNNDNASTTFFGVAQPGTGAALTGVAEAGEIGAISGNGGGATVQYGTLALAGSTGTYTSTVTTGGVAHVMATMALLGPVGVTGEKGAFSVVGKDATFKRSYSVLAATGSYAVAGKNANLKKGWLVSAGTGSFLVAGKNATFKKSYSLLSSKGSFLVSGNPVTVRTIRAQAGSFTVAGKNANFKKNSVFPVSAGSFNIAGKNASFVKGRAFIVGPGSYTVNGKNAILIRTIDPQNNLNNNFPDAQPGDGVVDQNTGDVWIYNGTLWVNSGPNPGTTIEASRQIPVYNETLLCTCITGISFGSKSLAYKLDLDPVILEPSIVTTSISVSVLNAVYAPPNSGRITLSYNTPSIRKGTAVFGKSYNIAINSFAPTVTASSGVGVPAASITINAFAGSIASQTKTIGMPSAVAVNITTGTPTLINISDPYWSNVVLLLRTEGSSFATNPSGRYFADAGPYNLTIRTTAKDSLDYTKQNVLYSSTRVKYGANSALFWDASSLLKIEANSNTVIGTSPFTVELWIYLTSLGSTNQTIIGETNLSNGGELVIYFNQTLIGVGKADTSEGFTTIHNGSLTVGAWHHLAVVRDTSSNAYVFLNGILKSSPIQLLSDFSSTEGNQGKLTVIGGDGTNGGTLRGFVEDLRITKAARYTSNFTVPSEQFEGKDITPVVTEPSDIPYSAVKLLIHGSGSIADSSSSGTSITATGVSINTTVQDPFGFTSGVLSFGGTSSYLIFGSNTGLVFGTDPFCLEFWVYLTSAYSANIFAPFANSTTNTGLPSIRMFCDSNGYGTETIFDILKTSCCPTVLNTWHHIAFTRDSLGEGRVFVDGKLVDYPEFLANYLAGYYWTGNGKTSFDTQINSINKLAAGDPYYDNVVLRVNFDRYNPANGVYYEDEADPVSAVLWTYQFGSGVISTADSKYGGASYYNGDLTLSGAKVQSSAYFNTGATRFNLGVQYGGETVVKPTTIEAFIKPTANPISDGQWLEYCVVGRASDYNLHVYPTASGVGSYISVWNDASFFYTGGASPGPAEIKIYPPAPGITLNQWHHVAITTDSSGNMFFWLNGAQVGWVVKSWSAGTGDNSSTAPVIEIGGIRRSSFGTPLNCFKGYIDGVRITNGKIVSGGWTPGVTRYTGVAGQQTGGTYTIPTYESMYSNLAGSSPGLNGYMCEVRVTKGYARYVADFDVPNGRYPNTEKLGVMVLKTIKVTVSAITPEYIGSRPVFGSVQHYQSLNGENITITWPSDASTYDVGLLVIALEGNADTVPTMPTTTYPVWNSAITGGKFSTSQIASINNGADSDSSIVAAWWTKLTGGYPTANPSFTISGSPSTATRLPIANISTIYGSPNTFVSVNGSGNFYTDAANPSNTISFQTDVNNKATVFGCTLDKSAGNWYDSLPSSATATFTLKYALCDADGSLNNGYVQGPIAPINTGNNITFTVQIGVYNTSTSTFTPVFTGPSLTTTLTLSWTQVSYQINTSLLVPYASSPYRLAMGVNAAASGGSPNTRRSLAVCYYNATWPLGISKVAASFVTIKNTSTHPSGDPFQLAIEDTATNITARSGSQRICPVYSTVTTPTNTCQSPASFSEQKACVNLACFITPLGSNSDIFSNDATCSSLTGITKTTAGGVNDASSNLGSTIQFVYGSTNKFGDLAPITITKSASTKYISLSWVFENNKTDAYTNYIYARISGADGEPLNETYWAAYKTFLLNLLVYNGCSLVYNFGGAKYYSSCMFATTCGIKIIGSTQYYITNSSQTWYQKTELTATNFENDQYSRTTGLRGSPSRGSYIAMPSAGTHWWLISDVTPATTITTYARRGEIIYGNSPSGYAHTEWAIEQDDLGWSYTPWDYNASTGGIDGYRYNNYGVAGPGTEFVGFSGAYFNNPYYWWIEGTWNSLTSSGLSSSLTGTPYLFASPGTTGMTNFSNAKVFCGVHVYMNSSSQASVIKSYMDTFYNSVKDLQI
jgi:hypothetical protein